MRKSLIIALLFSIYSYSQEERFLANTYVSAAFDIRNGIVGSDPTNNKAKVDGLYQFGMIGNNVEVTVGYENFNAIKFDRYFITAGYQFPLYAYIGGKEIKTTLITSYVASLIGRWGEEWGSTSSHLSLIGLNTALRYEISSRFAADVLVEAIPRVDLHTRYPEVHDNVPIKISVYLKIKYRL